MILFRYAVFVDGEPYAVCKSMFDAMNTLSTADGEEALIRDRSTGRPMRRGKIADIVATIKASRVFNTGHLSSDVGAPLHGRER